MLKLIYYFDMRNLAILGVLCLLFLSCSHQDEESVPEDLTQEFVVENGTLVKYHPQGDGAFRVHIPENVTTIAPGVFKGMDVLTVDGPSVRTIMEEAFAECHNLTTIRFKQVKTIGEHAFQNCTALKFYFTQVVPDIEWETFKGTSQEKILVLPKELWPDALNVEDAGFNLQENLLPALETPRYGWPDNHQIIVIGDAKSANSVLL